MSLVLKENEKCPYSKNCPYSSSAGTYCHGEDSSRKIKFVCDLITSQGSFIKDGFRSPHDQTGKMKIIMEGM